MIAPMKPATDCMGRATRDGEEMIELFDAILNGDRAAADVATRKALASGVSAADLIEQDMIPAMDEVGRRFETEEYFVPELLLAGRAMKAALVHVRPLLAASGVEPAGRVVIGSVKGDLHDIGKNLVGAMLEGGGFEVTDLGTDVAPGRFVETINAAPTDIVCLSALLTVTMPAMRDVIEALKSAGLRERVKVIVGGAPVTAQYAREIGADAFGENAGSAVTLARRLMEDAHQHA
jgi:corrinoid protein of di/trimethylamine methyltransferase